MPRSSRQKSPHATFYHLFNRVAGDPGYFPLQKRPAARKFLSLFEFYFRLYFCRLASFELMGNHYHAVVHFEQFRPLDREELERRARLRFGRRWTLETGPWSQAQWEQFNRDPFDVSRFMQHVNGEFSKLRCQVVLPAAERATIRVWKPAIEATASLPRSLATPSGSTTDSH